VAEAATLHDVQVKRIHEYERQHLAALYVADTYLRIEEGNTRGLVPRTYVFSGKAAPAYRMAKLIIRFINALSKTIAADADARKWLHVMFVPDFNVKNAQHIHPAADLSEQISPKEPGLFGPLVRNLAESDPYLVLADYDSHVNAQGRVAAHWMKPDDWVTSSILEVARMDFYSSDRAIRDYAERVWNVQPVDVDLVAPRATPR
jgi:glucan phosphorylase